LMMLSRRLNTDEACKGMGCQSSWQQCQCVDWSALYSAFALVACFIR
jgi:hypothetical protein